MGGGWGGEGILWVETQVPVTLHMMNEIPKVE